MSSFQLRSGEITDPDHADIAVRPGLLRSPLDEVVHITTFPPIKKTKSAARPTGAPTVSSDVDVTTGDEEIAGTGFNEASGRTKVLNLSRIGGGGNQYGILTGFGRTMQIRQQHSSITHWHRNIVIVCHRTGRLRQVAILTSGLRTVEPTLTGVRPGRLNVVHALPCRRVRGCRVYRSRETYRYESE